MLSQIEPSSGYTADGILGSLSLDNDELRLDFPSPEASISDINLDDSLTLEDIMQDNSMGLLDENKNPMTFQTGKKNIIFYVCIM